MPLLKITVLLMFVIVGSNRLDAFDVMELTIVIPNSEQEEAMRFTEEWRNNLLQKYNFEEKKHNELPNFHFWTFSTSNDETKLNVSIGRRKDERYSISFSYIIKDEPSKFIEEHLFPEISKSAERIFEEKVMTIEKHTVFVCD